MLAGLTRGMRCLGQADIRGRLRDIGLRPNCGHSRLAALSSRSHLEATLRVRVRTSVALEL
jgi:hypothetical protein